VDNLIFMNDRTADGVSQKISLRDRRYAIRFPFAADAEVLDLESGVRSDGITSDISLGGVFVCTSKPLAVKTRARVILKRKGESVEALAIVRIVKPRIGMGLEFLDIESTSNAILTRWMAQLRRER
jgi:PilZ domain-containing protein